MHCGPHETDTLFFRINLEPTTRVILSKAKNLCATVGALAACVLTLGLGSVGHAAESAALSFSQDVRPILSDKCFQCHGPDEEARQADLRLDLREPALGVLAPGTPDDSELVRRIESDDPDERMPPAHAKLTLEPGEVATLKRWIAEGADYEQHWSFRPIEKPEIPTVQSTDWPRNEIDYFILARLEAEGLEPAPEASKERLIRRLRFDLTGLPPTLAEIDEFLADDSPGAYEALVDRLLAQEAYGERMAADWLDVARYADSYGYQVDRDRFVWPWKEWVIRAFNANLPYDQFITQQLAGDLLPDATDEQVLATTFNRLHPQKVEGGSVPEEFRVEYVADRNHTFATAFLGLTLECSRCHDHKFDPISQKEYYQLFAFFNNIDECGLYSYHTPAVPTPTMLLTDDAKRAQIAEVERQIAEAEEELHKTAATRREAFRQWLDARPQGPEIPGRVAHLEFEDAPSGRNQNAAGVRGQAVKLSGDDEIKLDVGNFRRFQPFSVALWINTPEVKERAVVFHRTGGWTDAGSRGYQLLIEEGRLSASLIHFWPGNAIRVRTREAIPTGEWLHVVVTNDGSSRADGLKIFLNGQPADCEVVRDHLTKNITGGGGDNLAVGARNRDRGFTGGLVDDLQVFERELTPIEIAQISDDHSLADALQAPADELTGEQKAALFEYYLANVDDEYRQQLAAVRTAREERSNVIDDIPEIMVMRELAERRPTFLLKRGAYDAPADEVSPEIPAVFPAFPDDAPRDRLGLARWLTDPAHPLTSRVAVNRLWQLCFGQGFVRTPEDFGSQGEPPTHPALLDWLADDFRTHGWDVKRLLEQIVTSATYRQSSQASPAAMARDPGNRWLSRAPRYRLPAEMVRDNALAVSGLMDREIGGPPVRPYEVAVSFKPVKRDEGTGLYRRSLYTYWKRTAPAPVMMSLDAAKRDVCMVKRERTSSPLQALVLLNDPQFVEAARVLGEHALKQYGADANGVIEYLFRTLTSRRPTEQEQDVLQRLYQEQLAEFEADPEAAVRFLQTGDAPRDESIDPARLAAVGVLTSALMNFDECVMRR